MCQSIFLAFKDSRWIIISTIIMSIVLSFGLYPFLNDSYADTQTYFKAIGLVAAYIPLFYMMTFHRTSVLYSSLPLSSFQVAISRYFIPLATFTLSMVAINLAYDVRFLIQDWYFLYGTDLESRIGLNSWMMVSSLPGVLPRSILLGIFYTSVPLAIDSLLPRLNSRGHGTITIFAISYLIILFGTKMLPGQWYGILYVSALTAATLYLEIMLYSRRRSFI